MAGELQRPVRETVTPAVWQKVVWAGANLGSSSQASDALRTLADIDLSAKRVCRIVEQVGQDRLDERPPQVAGFRHKPWMERIRSPATVDSPALSVLLLDGGRYQRRDHFGEELYDGSQWKEDKVGLVQPMDSEVHNSDPHPQFPEGLAVAQIAARGAMEEPNRGRSDEDASSIEDGEDSAAWLLPTGMNSLPSCSHARSSPAANAATTLAIIWNRPPGNKAWSMLPGGRSSPTEPA